MNKRRIVDMLDESDDEPWFSDGYSEIKKLGF